MDPLALRLNDHAHAITCLKRGDRLDRCAKICHIKTTAQPLGQGGFHELHHQRLPLLTNVNSNLVIRQRHDHAPGARFPTTEIKVT